MIRRIMKNFISSPATRMYPLKAREPYERSRGRIFCEQDNCIYCSLCQKKCPADAITVDRANSTWELNAFRCIICGECVNACPKKCIKMTNKRRHSSETKKIVKLKKTPL